jgi:hypothetical protein
MWTYVYVLQLFPHIFAAWRSITGQAGCIHQAPSGTGTVTLVSTAQPHLRISPKSGKEEWSCWLMNCPEILLPWELHTLLPMHDTHLNDDNCNVVSTSANNEAQTRKPIADLYFSAADDCAKDEARCRNLYWRLPRCGEIKYDRDTWYYNFIFSE